MKKNKNTHIEQFKVLLGYGHFRPYKNGFEVRVNDLDIAFAAAQRIIIENNLDLSLSERDIQLRSFVVSSTSINQ